MGVALEKLQKPTLGLIKEGSNLSRLVLGIDHPMYTLAYYETLEDILTLIREKELRHFGDVSSSVLRRKMRGVM